MGIVERSNKEVMRHLIKLVNEIKKQNKWSVHVPLVQRIFNAQLIESHDFAPADILFGNALQLDRNMFMNLKKSEQAYKDLDDYHKQLLLSQENVMKVAIAIQKEKDREHMTSQKPQVTEYAIGSYVTALHRDGKKPNKLATTERGPFKVASHVGGKYKLQHLVTNKIENHHLSRLAPFFFDAEKTTPEDVATEEVQAWDIERIVRHKGNMRGAKNQLKFLVRWGGDVQPKETWEPWRNADNIQASLYHTEQLHDYLRAQKLQFLIPRQYK